MDYQNIWNKIWRDDGGKGQIVIWQTPNLWLIGWAVFTFVSLLLSGKVADVLSWIASASLIVWAGLEIFKGVNYFRRALGVLVLIFSLMTLIKSL